MPFLSCGRGFLPRQRWDALPASVWKLRHLKPIGVTPMCAHTHLHVDIALQALPTSRDRPLCSRGQSARGTPLASFFLRQKRGLSSTAPRMAYDAKVQVHARRATASEVKYLQATGKNAAAFLPFRPHKPYASPMRAASLSALAASGGVSTLRRPSSGICSCTRVRYRGDTWFACLVRIFNVPNGVSATIL